MADETPSKVLTRRQLKELLASKKLEGAPMKENKKLILHRDTDDPTTSREGLSTPVPCNISPRGTEQQSNSASKTTIFTKISTASSVARRKQLELEAAEAKAKIQMELIDKKLQVDLAKVDQESEKAHHVGTDVPPDEGPVDTYSSSLHSENKVQDNVEKWLDTNCTSPVQHDNSIQQLADMLKDMMTHSSSKHDDKLLSRLATPRELPIFSGDSIEWLHFKSAYDDSSRVCEFSDSENLWRLRKSLRGEAKEAVTDLLIGNTPPAAVMEALALRFGRADIIISNITMQLKKLPSLPTYYQQDLINMSIKVNNCVATIRALEQKDYLRSPELAAAIISKLPSTLIGRWTEFAYKHLPEGKSKLELLATFLKLEAEMLSVVGCTQPRDKKPMDAPTKRTEDKYRHRTVNTSSVTAAADNNVCRFCQKDSHTLPECRIFKRAMRRDKWRFVKMRGLCYCCLLTRHNKDTCPAPMCDVDNCGMAHHRLLHWTRSEVTSQSADKVTVNPEPVLPTTTPDASMMHFARDSDDASIAPEEFALLKVIAVQLRGPKGVVNTYALLDDGAEVSVIDAELADSLGLECDSARPIRFTDAFGLSVYQSEVPSVRVKITGQDNTNYDSPLEVLHGDRDSLYASRCRLGWTIHGFHRGRTHTSVSRKYIDQMLIGNAASILVSTSSG
ncbi:reverse transcriptase [Operophtera brumata]|uniref:Reverse transcriptase n=1 Tax=Operophtera brumata TaxID=104452 RepID=A0A0L7L2J0_OPEBR|nr:reverse transcriptase [Operophtera brumata]